MHAHLRQTLHVLDCAQVFGVHHVGAVLIFKGTHELTRTLGFFNQEHLVGRLTFTQGWLGGRVDSLHSNWFLLVHDIPRLVFFAFVHLVFPTASVGAGALVRVTLVQVARQQATTGIGHAQRAVDKNLQLHIWHLLANFGNFVQ